jgi:hypothetical protein
MRTTIEITDGQRARLLALAASRGRKGFSGLVQEAIDLYLDHVEKAESDARTARSLGALGALSEDEASELGAAARRAREDWP